MKGPLLNRSMPKGGNGHIFKVPLKSRLRSFSKTVQEKRTKSEIVESRSPSYSFGYSLECSRDEPEDILIIPTARRLSELSEPLWPFQKRRIHGIRKISRKSLMKGETQIRSPHQSRKCLKKLPPALNGRGITIDSPWVSPSCASVYHQPGAHAFHHFAAMTETRMDIIETVSTEEQDLPQAISPAYKFVPIEMAERMEADEANECYSFSSSDYDICTEEYMMSHQEQELTSIDTIDTTKGKKSQKKDKKKQNSQSDEVDKYAIHEYESFSPFRESPSKSGWWKSLEECITCCQLT